MKVIGFSAVEILPALLKTFGYNDDLNQIPKDQTIRKAWKMGYKTGLTPHEDYWDRDKNGKSPLVAIPKDAHYSVGEVVQVMWKQRTSPKGSWFCTECGMLLRDGEHWNIEKKPGICPIKLTAFKKFPKILGTETITEVFKIEMQIEPLLIDGKTSGTSSVIRGIDRELRFSEKYVVIPARDGFKDSSGMFDYFDKAYDLSKPRTFWVYRFEKLLNPELV